MKILAIETSASAASAAVCEDLALLGEYFVNTRKVHSQTLMPMVGSLLHNLSISPAEIELYAVAAGPGSFTGVRIGVAAVKGMAMARNTPCIGVSSLEAMAHNLPDYEGMVCCVMDARRDQVYNALFEAKGGMLRRLIPDRAVSVAELRNDLLNYKKNCMIVGDGAELCYNGCRHVPGVRLAPESLRFQKASSVAIVAYEQYMTTAKSVKVQSFTAEKLLPVYLRPAQAERVRLERMSESGSTGPEENS